jgi:hypothetical protein
MKDVALGNVLELVIICQFLSSHDPSVSSKKSHPRLPCNNPFDHSAIGFTRMVDESSNRSSCSINDHILIKEHEVVTLVSNQLQSGSE